MTSEEFRKALEELSPEERESVDRILRKTKIEWARDDLVSQTEFLMRMIPKLQLITESDVLETLHKTAESVLPRLKSIDLDDPDAEEKMKKIYGELEKVRDDFSAQQGTQSSQKIPNFG